MDSLWSRAGILVSLALLTPALMIAGDGDPYAKQIAPASDAGVKAIRGFQVADGLKVTLFAAEPLLANPVAFCFDEKGRCYVAETFRLHKGATDNRNHGGTWTDDDLAARTVADRLALYRKHLGKDYRTYGVEHDRVRLIEDTDGDGIADKASVFADGFTDPADGLGSGVLARGGKVWFACIPHLWLLQDTKGTGKADVKKSLHEGYGVHVSFIGHDSHGLCMGPDGKVYFSIGDRGLEVATGGRTLSAPDTGAVLRCNPDGSELEIVHQGLRNPQELAFDEFGNLFTGDNNADGGDQARWVQIVEGGDSGWRIGYQYMPGLGPWNREKMWHTAHDTQPAFLVPPLTHIGSGPSGLTYNPGVTLLPEKYKNHFFLCDFRGGPKGSAIHAFTLKPKGASFEVADRSKIIESVLATDCDFGPDGGLYVSDWVDGWGLPNKGRIYKLFDPSKVNDPEAQYVKRALGKGMSKASATSLAKLLEHGDMRLRQEAQFELAKRRDRQTLAAVARSGSRLARLHGLWGLGQIERAMAGPHQALLSFATDADAEVRAQAIRLVGESRHAAAKPALHAGLKAAEPRVRFFSAIALGKLGDATAVPAILQLVRENADKDPYLRHAGVMALTGIGDPSALEKAAGDESSSVRLAVLLAMRRLHLPEVAKFLDDAEPRIQVEAARAIYDEPIPAALPQLAALLVKGDGLTNGFPAELVDAMRSRVIAAQRRLPTKEHATLLASMAGDRKTSEVLRLAAVQSLETWDKPTGRDPIVGLWRPLPPGTKADVVAVLAPVLSDIMSGSHNLRAAGARLAVKHDIKEVGPFLREMVQDGSFTPAVRVESLKALQDLKDPEFEVLLKAALGSQEPRLRQGARAIWVPGVAPEEAARQLAEVLDKGTTLEKQGTFALLADLGTAPADALLSKWLDQLVASKVPAEVQLDILEAAQRRGTPELKARLAKYDADLPKNDLVLPYRAALAGGDAERGRDLFFNRIELSCLRCHKVQDKGGDVGPDLTGISKRFPRPYLLEAIVDPNRQIAKGFETVVLALQNGQIKSGILKSEDAKEVRLMNAEGQMIVVPKADIEERTHGKSAMPNDVMQKLTRRELRDLIEYLAGL